MEPSGKIKAAAPLLRRPAWARLSGATLVAILQRAPLLRLAAVADGRVAATPVGALLISAVAVASLGAVDSMAGATLLATTLTPDPTGNLPVFNATVGVPITPLGFTIANLITIGSWEVTGQIPPGLVLTTVQSNGGSLTGPGVLDATNSGNTLTTPILEGTPVTAGTYTAYLQGFWMGGESGGPYAGKGVSALFPFTVVVGAATAAPAFTTRPLSVTVTGGTVALDAVATNASSYQWMRNGSTPVAGATGPILLIGDAATAAGSYTCIATNAMGSTASTAATVSLASTGDPGRMVNLSARAIVGTGSNIIFAGFAIGGAGTSGSQSVLVRASGPAIEAAPFSVPNTLDDPQLQLFSGQTVTATNDGWGGNPKIAAVAAAVGAFGWSSASSHDAALYVPLPGGPYTAQVSGESGDYGAALVEVYDATPPGTYTLATPRLTNLSARVNVGAGPSALFAGFVIGGTTAMTVLIRASGPAIAAAPFDVPGTLVDPQLTLEYQSSGDVIASNSSWGGDTRIVSAAAEVGAFGWSDSRSHDSALLITLPPGNYTALAAGASSDTGVAIVEVYEVP